VFVIVFVCGIGKMPDGMQITGGRHLSQLVTTDRRYSSFLTWSSDIYVFCLEEELVISAVLAQLWMPGTVWLENLWMWSGRKETF